MKPSTKAKLIEAVLEIVGEILICAIGFGIGYGVLHLFGIEDRVLTLDPDLLVLIGLFALAALSLGVGVLVHLLKRKRASGKAISPEEAPDGEGSSEEDAGEKRGDIPSDV